jgi:UDP-N-acetylmuramyl pentapeptide phosphotransferase/UDP-N-acetylglucosamine-1-phosphate transferase
LNLVEKKNGDTVTLNGGFYFILIFISISSVEKVNNTVSYYDYFFVSKFNYKIVIYFILFLFIGVLDDKIKLKPLIKLFLQFLIIILLLISTDNSLEYINFIHKNYSINIYLLFAFTLFCLVSLINAYNYIDGINGISLIYFIFIQIFLILNFEIFILIYTLIPTFVFLFFNLKRWSFLGNSGSHIVPLYLGLLLISLHNDVGLNFFANEIIFLLFLPGLDFIYLTISRCIKRVSPFAGDQNHFHHVIFKKTESVFATNLIYLAMSIIPILLFKLKINQFMITLISITIYLLIRKFFIKK